MIVLKHEIMKVTLDKHKDKSKADHYYKSIVYRFKKDGITASNEFNLIYDISEDSIKARRQCCVYLRMYLDILKQIQTIIDEV